MLDALDYTRSAADAAALQSLSAAGNLVVTNMMMDTSRHHMSTLRSHMALPSATVTTAVAMPEKGSTVVASPVVKNDNNVWVDYEGGHDMIGADKELGKYTQNFQGAIAGVDHTVSPRFAIGMSVGYEHATGKVETTKAETDTLFFDLYGTAKTGKFNHRFSAGVAWGDFDVTRQTHIAAAHHSYSGTSKGSLDAVTVNLGYELSRTYELNEKSALTPFFAVDVALHHLGTLKESGQGTAGVVTDYDNPTQVDVALGVTYNRQFRSFTEAPSTLNLTAAVHGELAEHRATAQNLFVGGIGESWKTRSAMRRPFYGEIGGGVNVPVYKTWSATAGGSFEFSKNRAGLNGNIGVNYKF